MDFQAVLDQMGEIVSVSDQTTDELLYRSVGMRKHRRSQYSYRGKRTSTVGWLVPVLILALTLVVVFATMK